MIVVPNDVIDSLSVILDVLEAGNFERARYLLRCLRDALLPEEN